MPDHNSVNQDKARLPRILVMSWFAIDDPARITFYNNFDSTKQYTVMPVLARDLSLKTAWGAIKAAFRLRYMAFTTNPDLIILEDFRTGMVCCLINRLLGVRVPIVLWHFNMIKPYKGWKLQLARWAVRMASGIVVYSRHEQSLYSELFGVSKDKIHFKLFSGPYLDDPRYAALLNEPKQNYVVAPGYFARDFELLAEVAAILPEIHFVVLAFPYALEGVKLPPNVELRHGIPEVEYCRNIAAARLCFLPIANRQTANGHTAIIQAMSLKTLLLTNSTPGTIDYLRDDLCLVFEGRDAKAVAAQLKSAYDNVEEWKPTVDQAYQFALDTFSVRADVKLINQILDDRASAKSK